MMVTALGAGLQRGVAADDSPFDQAKTLFQENNYAAIIKKLAPLWANNPKDFPPQAAYWLGVSYFETGELSLAEPQLLRAERELLDPEVLLQCLMRLVQISRRAGRMDRAVEFLNQALETTMNEADFQRVLLLLGETQQEVDLQAAL